MYVGLLMRAQLIMAYKASHSPAFRDRNMTLLVALTFEFAVGGDRIEMSSAVPLRKGTSGVSSKATRGCTVGDELRESESLLASPPPSLECAADISKASINPGDTTIEHSFRSIGSQPPLSDHEQTMAIVLAFLAPEMFETGGTDRYGP
jgi:hypothetical protein